MGGAVEAVVDIGGDVLSSAADVGSFVTDLGTEFLSSDALGVAGLAFGVPSLDFASFGGFEIAGSLAGDASWFNTFNPGAILDSLPSVGDFSLPSLGGSLPSLSSIVGSVPSVSDFQGYVRSAQTAVQKIAPITQQVQNIAGYAGIQIPGTQLLNTAAGAINLASAGLNVANVAGSTVNKITSGAQTLVPDNGIVGGTFRELSTAETAQLMRGVNPVLVNSLVDPGTTQSLTYATAVRSRADLIPIIAEYNSAIVEAEQNIQSNNANIAAIEAELRDETLPDARREELEAALQANYENNAIQENNLIANREYLAAANTNLTADQQVIDQTVASATAAARPVAGQTVEQYQTAYNSSTNTWSIYDIATGETVQTGLTERQAILAGQDLNIGTSGITLNTSTTAGPGEDPFEVARLSAEAAFNAAGPTEADVLAGSNSITTALTNQARNQQAIRSLRNNQAQSTDWRVRLRLAPNSNYLYNSSQPGILAALKLTDGVIFPYTPTIETAYKANYDPYDLTHSNYRGYFYKGSYVDAINVRAQFTAQDSKEADYLLAVIHFFRSCTKMFYGQDQQRGAPPPLVYLNGYGDYQFNEHPCVVSQFNYNLPSDVDYIRAQSALSANTNQLNQRLRNPLANNPLAYSVNRLLNSNLLPGALDFRPAQANNLVTGSPTYVPTKMEISITLLPMQSRAQVSNNFSVREFANGNLLRQGYW